MAQRRLLRTSSPQAFDGRPFRVKSALSKSAASRKIASKSTASESTRRKIVIGLQTYPKQKLFWINHPQVALSVLLGVLYQALSLIVKFAHAPFLSHHLHVSSASFDNK